MSTIFVKQIDLQGPAAKVGLKQGTFRANDLQSQIQPLVTLYILPLTLLHIPQYSSIS